MKKYKIKMYVHGTNYDTLEEIEKKIKRFIDDEFLNCEIYFSNELEVDKCWECGVEMFEETYFCDKCRPNWERHCYQWHDTRKTQWCSICGKSLPKEKK